VLSACPAGSGPLLARIVDWLGSSDRADGRLPPVELTDHLRAGAVPPDRY
jgi:hypothetical protein